MLRTLRMVVLACVLLVGAPLTFAAVRPAEELVVAVHSTVAGETILSAGVLVGFDDSNVYVLTVAHALQAGPRASQITVTLPFARAVALPARILKTDAALDLAALRVAATATQLASLQNLPFDALGSSKGLVQGSQVFHSGHPNGMLWQMSVAPNFVTKHEGPWILFESQSVAKGSSGGALIDEAGELIGIIRSDEPPVARALAIEDALAILAAAKVPVKLRPALAVGAVTTVSVGGAHACAVDDLGALYCWGANGDGQLGIDSRIDALRPRRVAALSSGVAQVSAGGRHTCAINTKGELFCWGSAALGALGVKGTDASARPILVSQSLRFSHVSAGDDYTCGISTAAELYCWGANGDGQLGTGVSGNEATPARVRLPVTVSAVSANTAPQAESHTCAVGSDHLLYCWGSNQFGQLGLQGSRKQSTPIATHPKQRFRSVSVGSNRSCALLMNNKVACWGEGSTGKDGVAELFATAERKELHVMSDVPMLMLSGARWHMCAVSRDSVLYCWGSNSDGQMATVEDTAAPTSLLTGVKFATVATGAFSTCALSQAGDLGCFGRNDVGQLGAGETKRSIGRVTR